MPLLPFDLQFFYQCLSRGVNAYTACQPGLVYNERRGWCDYPSEVLCQAPQAEDNLPLPG